MTSEPYKFKRLPRKKPKPVPPYVTVLERHPRYLKCIGTISVEMVNLEVMLADLLAAILRAPEGMGQAIYFAPQATGPRLTIVAKAAEEAFTPDSYFLKKSLGFTEKARKLANKRNEIVHEAWGLSIVPKGKVTRRKPPFTGKDTGKPIPISEIDNAIYSVRVLIGEVRWFTRELVDSAQPDPSPDTPPAQDRAEMAPESSRPKARPPKPPRPPRS